MEYTELIEKRRSIRAFDASRKVTEEEMKELVYAAIQAPSWKNSQTARYYAVLSDEMNEKVLEGCLPGFNAASAKGAALVVTTFLPNRSGFERDGNPTNECGNGWGYYDLGLHNENFVLRATDMGLDTLIMGIRDADKLRGLLSIPEEEIVVAVIAVGKAAHNPDKPKRKKPEDILKVF
ncbi:MAG: nitroreductase family protein [Lachnospiraceae bacterium]|nr:nitroreductase family protein [Lachnospiraceae bacterium]